MATALGAQASQSKSTHSLLAQLYSRRGVDVTQAVGLAMAAMDWETAMQLRGPSFERNLQRYNMLSSVISESHDATVTELCSQLPPLMSGKKSMNIAIVHIGGKCSGMNAAVWAAARYCLTKGFPVVGIQNVRCSSWPMESVANCNYRVSTA